MQTRKHRNYSEEEVVRILSKKSDALVDIHRKVITIRSEGNKSYKGDLGNGSKGKIDFLTEVCGYTKYFAH